MAKMYPEKYLMNITKSSAGYTWFLWHEDSCGANEHNTEMTVASCLMAGCAHVGEGDYVSISCESEIQGDYDSQYRITRGLDVKRGPNTLTYERAENVANTIFSQKGNKVFL